MPLCVALGRQQDDNDCGGGGDYMTTATVAVLGKNIWGA